MLVYPESDIAKKNLHNAGETPSTRAEANPCSVIF